MTRESSPRILVVIPCKDNAGTIAEVVSSSLEYTHHVVVIDDGSTDGTGQAAAGAGAVVLTHPRNRGKGHAIITALNHAAEHGYSHIITLDGDLQHRASDLPAFFSAIDEYPEAIWIGVRELSTAPGASRFGRRFSNFWIWIETGYSVGDSQSGYRCYPVASTRALDLRGGRYEFEVDVITWALWSGIHVLDIPIDVFYPPQNQRVSSFDPLRDNLRISMLNSSLVIRRIGSPALWCRANPGPKPNEDKSWGQFRGTHWGWRFNIGLLRKGGRWPVYAFIGLLTAWFAVFAPDQRRGLTAYLRRMFPTSGPLHRLWLTLRIFYNFAVSIIDRFALLSRGLDEFRFIRDRSAEARANIAPEQGFIVISTHLGNAEVGAATLNADGTTQPVYVMRFVAENDPYTLLAQELRPDGAPSVIPLNHTEQVAALHAARVLREGCIVAIKADRPVDDRVAEVSFLGDTMYLPVGPFLLAAITHVPVLFLGCFKEGFNQYRVLVSGPHQLTFSSRSERQACLQRWAQMYATQIEEWTRRYPLQWYNFHDVWDLDAAMELVPTGADAASQSPPATPKRG